ncbi:TPA: glutamine--fructose-6-phosphate transaminase (isomerizing) [archaeon]|nr:glutamine--fructose-6-phosphate transaminase (isomerizing) [Candidatus Undinarchaeales archaeon SRR5007147.bin71]
MCGIIGYTGKRKASGLLLNSLKRLEYRGYDSIGIAVVGEGLEILKDRGEVSEVSNALDFTSLEGNSGIGHTRWATHGAPTKENAHPLTDCSGKIAVVHNGIIENYSELKNDLEKKGHKFKSETDTEVIAHILEDHSLKETLEMLRGSYAIVAIKQDEPGKLLFARNKSPLIIGLKDEENFIASDIPAFLKETNKVLILENGDYGYIKKSSYEIRNVKGSSDRKVQEINWDAEAAEKEGYEYFALKEIHEIPRTTENTMKALEDLTPVAEEIKKYKRIMFTACGTSYHAALYGKYLFNSIGIRTEAVIGSEFASVKIGKDDLVIAISQSGETADTLSAVEKAKMEGAKILSISNVLGSSLEREADFSIHTLAGPEIAVIATKTFSAQMLSLYLLYKMIKGEKPETGLEKMQRKVLELEPDIRKIAEKIQEKENAYFIGRGLGYPLAMEGALKLKEISYMHAEGMPAGELKHGTLSLIEKGTPVIVPLLQEMYDKTISNMEEVKARGGLILALSWEGDEKIGNTASEVLRVPKTGNEEYPLLYILILQLLAYHVTVLRGLSPDKPRNLAKCVTVE